MHAADRLLAAVDRAEKTLAAVPQSRAQSAPAPGQWSAVQVLGHLLDSAANNHQRFVRASSQDDLVFAGYDQDHWVAAQDHANARWPELLALWAAYNRHLARVMRAIPDAVRTRPHARHNFDDIGWQPPPASEPATLDWLLHDYVGHLRHHLRQIDALLGTRADDPAAR